MSLDHTTAQLGWKTNDEPKCGPAHQLATNEDVDAAFREIAKMKTPRRCKEAVLEIVHLNPLPVEAAKKKNDGNRSTDFVYGPELRLVQEKLRCAQHAGPNWWCYISPTKPDEHIALGYEEVSLWARKIHDNEVNADCIEPPHQLRLDDLHERESRVHKTPGSKSSAPEIHVHINNAPLADHNASTKSPSHPPIKHRLSSVSEGPSSDSDSDAEALPLSDVLQQLNRKFPQLYLMRYLPLLKKRGIVYADTVNDFKKEFYLELGIPEGAVGPFMSGVKKALKREKREKKRAHKENISWECVEI
jgi:hypothetical protein